MVLSNPLSVSFNNLVVQEGRATPTATGYLGFKSGEDHPLGPELSPRTFNPSPYTVTAGYVGVGFDRVSSGAYGTLYQNASSDTRPYREGGTFSWDIAWSYKIVIQSPTDINGTAVVLPRQQLGARTMGEVIKHREILADDGRVTMSKGGQSARYDVTDADSNVDRFWGSQRDVYP